MRFWSPFHTYSLDIISDFPRKLVFRAPPHVRLQMTLAHLNLHQNPGTCLTHYNHDTCLWECYHAPCTNGHHQLFIWILDSESDDRWILAARFDVHVNEDIPSYSYPSSSKIFNILRCQLISPMNGILSKESLPMDIIIRLPCVRDVQLQIDENTVVTGDSYENDIYKIEIPKITRKDVKEIVVMALCVDDMYYSTLLTYKIE